MPLSKVVLFKAVTASVTFLSVEVIAFTVSISNPIQKNVYSRLTSSSLQRPATIIGWDDESNSYTSSFDEPSKGVLGGIDPWSNHFTSIADSISQNSEQTASLARLAVAFSPPEHSIKLEDITQIQVIQVSSSHMELSAVVCDESQCVTIFVPVPFQHDCSGCCDSDHSSTEACVLNNINELDVEVQHLLNQRNLGSQEEERELLRSLHDSSNLQYPSWWISPQTYEMSEESLHITNTLNQDGFQNQLQALAKKGLESTQDGSLFQIKRAAVCSIGPAGFYLRAIAVPPPRDGKSSQAPLEKESLCTVLEIPIPFSTHQTSMITDAASLRSAVLEIVSSI